MVVTPVSVTNGTASLAGWGQIVVHGQRAAELQLVNATSLDLPEEVAYDITASVVLLNGDLARLLVLPYAAPTACCFDLQTGRELFEPFVIERDSDYGMRSSEVRVAEGSVVFLCETTLAVWREDFSLVWVRYGDFGEWSLHAVQAGTLGLIRETWQGRTNVQYFSIKDGSSTNKL